MSLVMKLSLGPRLNPNGKPPLGIDESKLFGVLALLAFVVLRVAH